MDFKIETDQHVQINRCNNRKQKYKNDSLWLWISHWIGKKMKRVGKYQNITKVKMVYVVYWNLIIGISGNVNNFINKFYVLGRENCTFTDNVINIVNNNK